MEKKYQEQVERLMGEIVALTDGQREVLRSWILTNYDVRGKWVRRYTEPVKGFEFLDKRK